MLNSLVSYYELKFQHEIFSASMRIFTQKSDQLLFSQFAKTIIYEMTNILLIKVFKNYIHRMKEVTNIKSKVSTYKTQIFKHGFC